MMSTAELQDETKRHWQWSQDAAERIMDQLEGLFKDKHPERRRGMVAAEVMRTVNLCCADYAKTRHEK